MANQPEESGEKHRTHSTLGFSEEGTLKISALWRNPAEEDKPVLLQAPECAIICSGSPRKEIKWIHDGSSKSGSLQRRKKNLHRKREGRRRWDPNWDTDLHTRFQSSPRHSIESRAFNWGGDDWSLQHYEECQEPRLGFYVCVCICAKEEASEMTSWLGFLYLKVWVTLKTQLSFKNW